MCQYLIFETITHTSIILTGLRANGAHRRSSLRLQRHSLRARPGRHHQIRRIGHISRRARRTHYTSSTAHTHTYIYIHALDSLTSPFLVLCRQRNAQHNSWTHLLKHCAPILKRAGQCSASLLFPFLH